MYSHDNNLTYSCFDVYTIRQYECILGIHSVYFIMNETWVRSTELFGVLQCFSLSYLVVFLQGLGPLFLVSFIQSHAHVGLSIPLIQNTNEDVHTVRFGSLTERGRVCSLQVCSSSSFTFSCVPLTSSLDCMLFTQTHLVFALSHLYCAYFLMIIISFSCFVLIDAVNVQLFYPHSVKALNIKQ